MERRVLRALARVADFDLIGDEVAGEAEANTKVVCRFVLVAVDIDVESTGRLRGLGVTGSLVFEDMYSDEDSTGLSGEWVYDTIRDLKSVFDEVVSSVTFSTLALS